MTAGERWATEELDALRADRFTPVAWTRFLGVSLRRAADTRRERPQLARQARKGSILGLIAGLAGSRWAARARVPVPRRWSFVLWWLTVSVMLEWHLGMVEGSDGQRRERLTAADALTLLRLWSVPFLAAQGDQLQRSGPAFSALIGSAAASDVLDGVLARRAGTTRLGRDLDKSADALVVGVAACAAARADWLPVHAAGLTIARSAVPVGVVATSYFRTGRRPSVDSIGPGRRLAPALFGGLAAAPFSSRLAAALTSTGSLAGLALAVLRPVATDRAGSLSRKSFWIEGGLKNPSEVPAKVKSARRGDATSNRADRQHSAAHRADRGRARKRRPHAGRA